MSSQNQEPEKEKTSLFDWKMIRIPRAVFRVSAVIILVIVFFVSLAVAVKFGGERYPFLKRIGAKLGMERQQKPEQDETDSDVMETHSATLVFAKGDVTVKSKKELRFMKAEKGQILQEGDSIRTFSGGYAEVLFEEGNRLTIKPDSLVVIRAMKVNRLTKIRKSSINLLQSDVEAVVRRPKIKGSEFVIATPTAMAKISEAKVAVKVSKEHDSNLKVFQGTVDLKVGDKSVEVSENQSVAVSKAQDIEAAKDLPPAPTLLDPENLAEFFFKRLDEMTTILKWKHALRNVKYRIQVAVDPFFTDFVIVRTGLSEPGVVVQGLKSGIYYWRVSAFTSDGLEGDFSDYRVFKVTIDQTPPRVELDDVLLLKVSGKVNAQISGQTEADASVVINGVNIKPDRTGRFKYILSDLASEAKVRIAVEDRVGNRSVLEKTITVE